MSRFIRIAAVAACAAILPLSFASAQDGTGGGLVNPGAPPPPKTGGNNPAPSKPPAPAPRVPRVDPTPVPRVDGGGGLVARPGTPPPKSNDNIRQNRGPAPRDGRRDGRRDGWRGDDRRYGQGNRYDYDDGPAVFGFGFGFGVPGPGPGYEDPGYDDDEGRECGWVRERDWAGDHWVVRRVWRCWDN